MFVSLPLVSFPGSGMRVFSVENNTDFFHGMYKPLPFFILPVMPKMSNRNKMNPAAPIWWKGDDAVTLSPHRNTSATNYDEFSFQSSIQASCFSLNDQPSFLQPEHEDNVFVVPVRGSETPITRAKMPGLAQGSSTPEVELKLANAPAGNVQDAALEMYKLLKKNGLAAQADRAFKQLDAPQKHRSREKDNAEELVGMEYILKDGIVNYLRDVAKLSPPIPRQVVRFNDINLTIVQQQSLRYETFGNKLLGCFLGPFVNLLGKKSITRKVEVLKDLDGYIMPGTTTLLLGPPGSGKSSLLKVLAGRCPSTKTMKLKGTVMYNDRLASEVLLTRLIAYINGQLNRHLPFLTVRETLEFAEDCTQGMRPENFTAKMRKFFAQALVEGQDPYLEYVLHVLGLKGIENQLVGSGQDGISDTDKNRLTTAEIAMGTYAVMLYDQPCYGQDSLATYDLVFTLRAMSRIQQCSLVMSLVQVSPEVFDLFDRVILLGEGQILYQGPRQDVLHYFSQLGYIKPSHVDTGAFLQDIAAGEGGQYVKGNYKVLSIDDLVACYKASDLHKDVIRIVTCDDVAYTFWVESEPNIGLSVRKSSSYSSQGGSLHSTEVVVARLSSKVDHAQGIESTGHIQEGDIVTGISRQDGGMHYIATGSVMDRRSHAAAVTMLLNDARGHVRLQVERQTVDEMEDEMGQFEKQYVQSWWQSTKTLTRRQLKVASRLRILIILRLIQVIILGVFGGTIFYHFGGSLDPTEMNIVRAIGFVSTFSIMLINVVQLPVYMIQRPIFYKQRAQRFFRVSSYLAAHSIVNAPQSFLEALLYSIPVYFISQLSLEKNGLHYGQFFCLLFLVAYMGSFLVILLSTITPIVEAGNALAGLLVSLGLLFSGFVIYPSLTPKYWKWMLTANPLRWGNLIFCMAEFVDRYKQPCKDNQDHHFCSLHPDLSVGRAFLKFYQLETGSRYLAIAYSAIVGSSLILCFASYLALRKVVFPEISPSLPSTTNRYQQMEELEQDEHSISWNGLSRITDLDNETVWTKEDPESGSRDEEKEGLGWKNANIPVKPVTLSFHSLRFSIKDRKLSEEHVVLDRISGYAKPGTMLAIMGSMKSGKSTLLKCLARAPPGELKGDVLANGFKLDSCTFSRISGFVEKLDAHQPFLTVKESLEFSAGLRFTGNATGGQRALHVDLILELMGLLSVKDQLVGSIKSATGKTFELSKKLTIAVELAANPSILFLEDPTSDLDSVATRNILFALQTVTASGRTIISTIQQPSARVLTAFNNVLILRPGGEQVYFGPVGWNCNQLLEYFSSIPKVPQYDPNQNPVVYILDILGAGIKRSQPVQNFGLVYRASQLGNANAEELKKLRKQYKKNSARPVASVYAASYSRQAWLVFMRTQRFLWRNVQYTFGRLSGSMALGLLLGSIYFKISSEDLLSVSSRSLFIYIQVMLLGVIIANNVVPQLGSDRLVYYREQRAGMYAPIFYPVSWALAEIPYLFIATLAFVGIANGMAGIATDSLSHFLAYWIALFVFTTTVMYFGMFITIATPMPMLAAFVVSITNSIWVSASGVIVPKSKMVFFQWLYWANPFQYVTHALTTISFFCDTQSSACLACRVGSPCSGCSCKRLLDTESSTPGSQPEFVWDRLSKARFLDYDKLLLDFVALGSMSALFALLAFVSFVAFKHNRRSSNQ